MSTTSIPPVNLSTAPGQKIGKNARKKAERKNAEAEAKPRIKKGTRTAVLIPPSYPSYPSWMGSKMPIEVQLNNISLFEDVRAHLKCENTAHTGCGYLDQFGFKLCLLWDDYAFLNNIPHNILASDIAKKVDVYGPAIIFRDENEEGDAEPFTLQDLVKVLDITKDFDLEKYHEECSQKLNALWDKIHPKTSEE